MPNEEFGPLTLTAARAVVSKLNLTLRSLTCQSNGITTRIKTIRAMLRALAVLSGQEPLRHPEANSTSRKRLLKENLKVTNFCTELLRMSTAPLTIGQICDQLERHKHMPRHCRDSLLLVSGTLHELVARGMIRPIEVEGIRKWTWNAPQALTPEQMKPGFQPQPVTTASQCPVESTIHG